MRLATDIEAEALDLFRALLRVDTTNPPGKERAAAELLADSLSQDGIEPKLVVGAKGLSPAQIEYWETLLARTVNHPDWKKSLEEDSGEWLFMKAQPMRDHKEKRVASHDPFA